MAAISPRVAPARSAALNVIDTLGLESLADWRAEVARWFRERVPPDWRSRMLGASADDFVTFQREWLNELRSGGFLAPHWPKEWGGGFTTPEQVVIAEEQARAGAPRLELYFFGLFHAAGTLLGAGSEEQRRRHLPRILEGEMWCQGFSEPDAGSDLASLRTRAERHGDVYVVNGQKIWSSRAHLADFCLLLARTDREAPKREGISYFVMDMRSSGIEVRPIRQSTGERHFNEIFLTNVEIPVENLIGEKNAGWSIAKRTLSTERGVTMVEMVERLRVTFQHLAQDAAQALSEMGGSSAAGTLSQTLAELHAETEILRLLCYRMIGKLVHDGGAAPESSIMKLYYSELLQRIDELGTRLMGPSAQLERQLTQGVAYESGDWLYDYINSWGWTIGGGTSEIQRNVIAERVLDLPRDPAPA